MQNLEKLFESLDDKVFTADLKNSLTEQFENAVSEKAELIAAERLEEEIEALSEKSERHIDFLSEKAEEFTEMKQTEMVESLDAYMERVVEEFIVEAKESLEESIKNEKADTIIEAFDSMLVAAGVEVAKIVESKDDSSTETALKESIEKYDTLIDESIALRAENEQLIKMGVIAELKEGLTLVEADKFTKLAELVEFSKDASYADKLATIRESVKCADNSTGADTNVQQRQLDESAPVWAHLV